MFYHHMDHYSVPVLMAYQEATFQPQSSVFQEKIFRLAHLLKQCYIKNPFSISHLISLSRVASDWSIRIVLLLISCEGSDFQEKKKVRLWKVRLLEKNFQNLNFNKAGTLLACIISPVYLKENSFSPRLNTLIRARISILKFKKQ